MRSVLPVFRLLLAGLVFSAFVACGVFRQSERASEARSPVQNPVTNEPATSGSGDAVLVVGFHDATDSGLGPMAAQAFLEGCRTRGFSLATKRVVLRPGRVLSPAWCVGAARASHARWLITGQIIGAFRVSGHGHSLATEVRVHEGATGRIAWVHHEVEPWFPADPPHAVAWVGLVDRVLGEWHMHSTYKDAKR
jgi:hypothetical protein